uniref:Uncharacterized protein n=1 Tax=Salmo trutta TaxID=8032 RepID=A0A674C130_SALTR
CVWCSNIKMKSKKGKKGGEDDSDSDLDDDLDGDLDEEESLGSLDEEDLGDELEGPSWTALGRMMRKVLCHNFSPSSRSVHLVSLLYETKCYFFMLDENVGSKFDNIGMNAMANKDNAGVRQLKWEAQRDDWVRGRDVKTLRKKKAMFKRSMLFILFLKSKKKQNILLQRCT